MDARVSYWTSGSDRKQGNRARVGSVHRFARVLEGSIVSIAGLVFVLLFAINLPRLVYGALGVGYPRSAKRLF
jgi:hypothetical protein